jgi:hypothetical protein
MQVEPGGQVQFNILDADGNIVRSFLPASADQ